MVFSNGILCNYCFDCFRNATDAQRTYREVMYLTELGDHTNIVKLMGIMSSENGRDLYLVFNYMETDLHAVVRANILEEVHKQYIVYQLLKALKYIHSADLIHRDIKPSNLLLSKDKKTLKISDFGVSEFLHAHNDSHLGLRGTVAFLAPETFGDKAFHAAPVDIWAAGVTFFVMLYVWCYIFLSHIYLTSIHKTKQKPSERRTPFFFLRCLPSL